MDFIKRFIAEDVQCAMGGVQATSRISPNINVGQDCYANTILAGASVMLTDALKSGTARFDASDLMPSAVGCGSFWTGMVELHARRYRTPSNACCDEHREQLAGVLDLRPTPLTGGSSRGGSSLLNRGARDPRAEELRDSRRGA